MEDNTFDYEVLVDIRAAEEGFRELVTLASEAGKEVEGIQAELSAEDKQYWQRRLASEKEGHDISSQMYRDQLAQQKLINDQALASKMRVEAAMSSITKDSINAQVAQYKELIAKQQQLLNESLASKEKVESVMATLTKDRIDVQLSRERELLASQKRIWDEGVAAYARAEELKLQFFQASQKVALAGTGIVGGKITAQGAAAAVAAGVPVSSLATGGGSSGGGASFYSVTGFTKQMASFAMLAALFEGGRLLSHLVEGSQKVNDLRENLDSLSGSQEKAAKTLEYFSKVQGTTRATTIELMEAYNQMLPMLRQRGFGDQASQAVIANLSRLAAVRARIEDKPYDTMFEEMQTGYLQAVAGRVQGANNPFVKAIGVSRFDINSGKIGIEDMNKRLQEEARKADLIGDDFQSVGRKIWASFQLAFSKGFLENKDEISRSLHSILQELTKPDVLEGITKLAGGIAEMIVFIAAHLNKLIGVVQVIVGAVHAIFGIVEQISMAVVSNIAGTIQQITEKIGQFLLKVQSYTLGVANWLNNTKAGKAVGLATGMDGDAVLQFSDKIGNLAKGLQFVSDKSGQAKNNLKDLSEGYKAVTALGFDEILMGAARLSRDGSPETSSAKSLLRIPNGNYPPLKNDRKPKDYTQQLEKVLELTDRWNAKESERNVVDEISNKAWEEKVRLTQQYNEAYDKLIGIKGDSVFTKAGTTRAQAIADLQAAYLNASEKIDSDAAKKITEFQQNGVNTLRDLVEKTSDWNAQTNEQLRFWETLDPKMKNQIQYEKDLTNIEKSRREITESLMKLWGEHPELVGEVSGAISGASVSSLILGNSAKDALDKRNLNQDDLSKEKAWAKQFAYSIRQAAKDEKIFEQGAGDFIAGILGGSKEFGRSSARAFQESIAKGTAEFVQMMFAKLFGVSGSDSEGYTINGKVNPVTGKPYRSAEEALGSNPASQNRLEQANALMQMAQIGYASYQGGLSNQKGATTQAVLGSVASVLPILMSHPILAVITVAVAAIASAVGKAQARSEYPFAQFYVGSEGRISPVVGKTKNITDNELRKMVQEVQDKFDTFWNGYVNILLKAVTNLPQLVGKLVIPTVSGSGIGGIQYIQDNPSQYFMKHFDEWLSAKFPKDIADKFKKPMELIFTSMGMTVDQFGALWDKFSQLDPQKALQLWTDTLDAMIGISNAMKFFHASAPRDESWRFLFGDDLPSSFVRQGRGRAATPPYTSKTWESYKDSYTKQQKGWFNTDDLDKQIMDIGSALGSLTGEAQVQAAKQLSDLMTQKAEKEKEYMQQLINMMEDAKRTVEGMQNDIRARMMVKKDANGNPIRDGNGNYEADYLAQANFWKRQADQDLANMQAAKNADQANFYWQQYLQHVGNANQAWSQLGPNNAMAADQWMMDALTLGLSLFNKKVDSLGTTIDSLNDKFTQEVQPFINTFNGIMTKTGTTVDDVGSHFGGLIGPIDDVGHGFNRLQQDIDHLAEAIENMTGIPTTGTNFIVSARNRRKYTAA